MVEKCLIWVETQSSAQSFFQKLNFDKGSQKARKTRYQIFVALSNFAAFLYFVPNIFKSTYFEEQLRTVTFKIMFKKLRKIKICWQEILTLH